MANGISNLSFTHRRASARNSAPAMKLWGILSEDEIEAGFELLLDDDWHVSLAYKGKLLAHFDPFDYTMRELSGEINGFIQNARSDSFWSMLKNDSADGLPSWFVRKHPFRKGKKGIN